MSILTLVLLLCNLDEEEIVNVVIAVDSSLGVVLEDLIAIPGTVEL